MHRVLFRFMYAACTYVGVAVEEVVAVAMMTAVIAGVVVQYFFYPMHLTIFI